MIAPLEQTDPGLAEHFRLIVSGQHPVRGMSVTGSRRVLMLQSGRRVEFRTDPYKPCPCGSGKKAKFCCLQVL